jgi:tetratricopeptide (TPR) repeat protein
MNSVFISPCFCTIHYPSRNNHSSSFNESISYFDKALAINPKFGIAIKEKENSVSAIAAETNAINKGIALLSLGKYNESIPYFKALAIEPANSFALHYKAVATAAANATVLTNKGIALLGLGKSNESIAYFGFGYKS